MVAQQPQQVRVEDLDGAEGVPGNAQLAVVRDGLVPVRVNLSWGDYQGPGKGSWKKF